MVIYTEDKAEALLSKYVPVAKSVLAKNTIAAIAASNKMKFPLVLKLISLKALHKTEAGGVRIVNNIEELRTQYTDIMKSAIKKGLKPEGCLVQEFARGEEVIIGIKKDPAFGHVLLFGMGGKYVEIIKDVSFRACPIELKDAQEMIDELKYKKILYGARGANPVNFRLLKRTLVTVSRLPLKFKDIEELDINPFIINDRTGKVVDARIVMKN